MNLRDALGLCGCVALLAGLFMPAVRVPLAGRMSYLDIAGDAGTILLVLVALAFALLLARRYRLLGMTGLASLAVMLLGLLWPGADDGGAARGLSRLLARAAEPQWGLAAMLAGALLLVVAAAPARRGR